jgi:hypothetical protein
MYLTMASNEVAKYSLLGYLMPLNSFKWVLNVANPSSICVSKFGGCGGLGFSSPWSACGRFTLSLGSILYICCNLIRHGM